MRKNNIRKTKTDKVDTLLIAKTLMLNNYRFVTQHDIDIMRLRDFCRLRQKLIKHRTTLKIQLTTYIDQLFPKLRFYPGTEPTQVCQVHSPFGVGVSP